MPSPSELHEMASRCIDQCVERVKESLNVDIRSPSLSLKQRGKIAGSARLQSNEIRLNPILFKDNIDAFINVVIPHEVAHIAVYQLFGRVKPHGREWQSVMRNVFDLPADVTHRLNTDKVSGRTYPYACDCGQVDLSIRRHNKVIRRQQQYVCRTCGVTLTFAG